MSSSDPSARPTGGAGAPGAAVDDWDDHWARYESSARENPAQAYRRRLVFDLLDRGVAPERILDVGSGQGDLLLEARRRWPRAELAGVELSQAGVVAARRKVPAATFEQRDLLAPGAPGPALAGWATHAVCSEVLEHVEEPEVLLAAAAAYVAPGGTIVLTVPGG
jgi:trans-aconitate methyltransferase